MTWLRPLLAAGAWFALAARAAFAPLAEGTPVLWGNAADTQTPIGLTNLVAIDAGDSHVLGLRADGTVVTWAVRNGFIAPVPPGLDHIVAIAAGSSFNLALDRSGRIHGWGADNHVSRETIVNPPGWLTNVVSITAGYDSSAALTSDGYLIQWGSSHLGNLSGPLYPPSPRSYAIGQQFLVVAEGSGRLNGWGYNLDGALRIPAGATNLVQVDAGTFGHVVGLRADGQVLAWGNGGLGRTLVPSNLGNVVQVAAGYQHSVALRSDGSSVTWGEPAAHPASPPQRSFRIAAGNQFTVGLTLAPVNRSPNSFTQFPKGSDPVLVSHFEGRQPFQVHWRLDGVDIPGAVGPSWTITNLQSDTVLRYTPVAENEQGLAIGGDIHVWATESEPALVLQPVSTAVSPGTPVVLAAEARGSEPMTYRWFRNGELLAGEVGRILSIPPTTLLGSDEYQVEASNRLGTRLSAPARVAVGIPAWVRHPHSVDLLPGMTVRLSPQILSAEPVTFQWWRNGVPLPESTRLDLDLPGDIGALTGDYQVVAANRFGSTTSHVGEVRIRPASPVREPATVVAWGLNAIGSAGAPQDLTNAIDVAVGDAHGIALLPGGRARMWVDPLLESQLLPLPTDSLTNIVSVAAGDRAVLAVRADGSVTAWGRSSPVLPLPPGLSGIVQAALGWEHAIALRRDGTLVAWPRTNGVPPGLDQVVAVQAYGSDSLALRSDGRLWIWSSFPPSIPTVVDASEVRRFSGNHAVVRDGRIARRSDTHWNTLPGLESASPSADLVDGGTYRAILRQSGRVEIFENVPTGWVTPPLGLGPSTRLAGYGHHLAALTTAPFVARPPASTNLPVGSSLQLSLEIRSATPASFQWQHDGRAIPNATNPVLPLANLRYADEGDYTVRISNAAHSVTSAPAVVTLWGTPEIRVPVRTDVAAGDSLQLDGLVVGPGPIRLQWWYNGAAIPSATNARLTRVNAQSNFAGGYELRANNLYGETIGPVARVVIVPQLPRIQIDTTPRELPEGSTLALGGSASGSEPFQYQWLRNGQRLESRTQARLQLRGLRVDDAGLYQLEVLNPAGVSLSDPVEIRVVPSPPGISSLPRRQLVNAGNTVHLGAELFGSPPLSFQWYKDGERVDGGTNRVLQIEAVQGDRAGFYTVAVTNTLGRTQAVAVELRVLPGRGPGAPIGWGNLLPPGEAGLLQAVAAGRDHALGVRLDGSVIGWGRNDLGQATPPADLTNAVALAAGGTFSVALRDDGTLSVWGDVSSGVDRIPPEAAAARLVAVAAGTAHILVLSESGNVFAWGRSTGSALAIPSAATNIVAISSAGTGNTVLRTSGPPLVWGSEASAPPAAATNLISISTGIRTGIGIGASGRPVRWGTGLGTVPTAATNLVQVAVGNSHILGLGADGTVFAWGLGTGGEVSIPSGLSNGVTVAAGRGYSVALTRAAVVSGRSGPRTVEGGVPLVLAPEVAGFGPIRYQWIGDGIELPGETNRILVLPPGQVRQGRTFALRVGNPYQTWTGPLTQLRVITGVRLDISRVEFSNGLGTGIRIRAAANGATSGMIETWDGSTWRPHLSVTLSTGGANYDFSSESAQPNGLFRLVIP